MADFGPFDFALPTPQGQPGFFDNLGAAFSDPRITGAMIQGGLQGMMRPGWGMTPMDQMAMTVGAGGESVARGQEQERKQQESESKAGLREAQAQAAEAKARTAGSESSAAAVRQQNAVLSAGVRARLGYEAYRKEQERLNAKIASDKALGINSGEPAPILSWQDWAQRNGFTGLLGAAGGGGRPTPANRAPPKIGDVVDNHRYIGGDPGLETSWEPE
jgi:hypothetical protein